MTKRNICGVTCHRHMSAAKSVKFVGQQISCYWITNLVRLREILIMNTGNIFTKDEGEVVELTRTPEKKRKAEQL